MSDAPAKNAPKAEWVEFAVANGAEQSEAEQMSKSELTKRYGQLAEQQQRSADSESGSGGEGETDNPSPDQPGPEPEEQAAEQGTEEGQGDSLAEELSDDQPRHEFETAALARAEEAATGEVDVPEAEPEFASDRLLPGEAIGAEGPPPAPYQFSPRDGQYEQQQERNDQYAEKLADYHEENVQKAEEQAEQPDGPQPEPGPEPDQPQEPQPDEPQPEPEPEPEPPAEDEQQEGQN
jgi:hypothetical protein